MSDNSKTGEVENKVVIEKADVENVKEYSKHFKVPLPDELVAALDAFATDETFENQQEVKLQMCRWILTCPHQSFQDEMWNTPKEASKQIVFDLQFEKDLNDTLDRSKENSVEETE